MARLHELRTSETDNNGSFVIEVLTEKFQINTKQLTKGRAVVQKVDPLCMLVYQKPPGMAK